MPIRQIKFLRNDINRLGDRLGDIPSDAKKKIRSMEVKKINYVSECRAIIANSELPEKGMSDAWYKRTTAYVNFVTDLKETALADLEKAHEEAETLSMQAGEYSRHQPKGDAGWSEYQAKSIALREKIYALAAESPSKVIDLYKRGERIEDSILCYAVEMFGATAIKEAQITYEAEHPGMSPMNPSRTIFGVSLNGLAVVVTESSPERTALQLKTKAIQEDIRAAKAELRMYLLPFEFEERILKTYGVGKMYNEIAPVFWEAGVGHIEKGLRLQQRSMDEIRPDWGQAPSSVEMLPADAPISERIRGGIRTATQKEADKLRKKLK